MFDPGIFFGMDDATYHNDPSLGSTDIRRLLQSPCDYFWHSHMNPARPAIEPSPAQIFGRAVHKFVLEGTQAFQGAYAPADNPGNTRDGRIEREWITNEGKTPLRREDYDRILISGQMICLNPHLSDAFTGGYPEVSVFWERDGLRLKARFDYLKTRAICDLKSIRNWRASDFVGACRRDLASYRYDMQAEHYGEGRRAMQALVADGRVYGHPDPRALSWIEKAAAAEEFAFVFVFWQAEGAPITWATQISPGNPILTVARDDIEAALVRYRGFMDRFGTDTAWVLAEPIQELDMDDLPAWYGREA